MTNIPVFERSDDFVTSGDNRASQKDKSETKHRVREKIPNESIDNETRLSLLNLIQNTCSIR